MEYQREVKKNISTGDSVHYVNCLRLYRNDTTYDVSGDSTCDVEKAFYYKWKNCSHLNEVVVLNPPDLCHIHVAFKVKDGSLIAGVCPSCTSLELNTVDCYVKNRAKVSSHNYLVHDLSRLPKDMYVFKSGDDFTLPSPSVNILPKHLRDNFTKIPYTQESLILRHGPLPRTQTKMKVAEALALGPPLFEVHSD